MVFLLLVVEMQKKNHQGFDQDSAVNQTTIIIVCCPYMKVNNKHNSVNFFFYLRPLVLKKLTSLGSSPAGPGNFLEIGVLLLSGVTAW